MGEYIYDWLKKFKIWTIVFGIVFLVPPWIPATQGPPRAYSGDEPHYLLMLNSLIWDGDLNLWNNYETVGLGSHQAGVRFAGYPYLEGHVAWWVGGENKMWIELFSPDAKDWVADSSGVLRPSPRPGVPAETISFVRGQPAYSIHHFGLPLLLYILILPIITLMEKLGEFSPSMISGVVEMLSLYASSSFAYIGALYLFQVLGALRPGHKWHAWVGIVTLSIVCGTPFWHYSRTLFVENYLAVFLILAVWFWIRGSGLFQAGALIGLGILMKPVFLLMLFPFLFVEWFGRPALGPKQRAKNLFKVALGPFCAGVFFLLGNYLMFGHPFRMCQRFFPGEFVVGLKGLLVSVQSGLIWFAPSVFFALPGWYLLMKEKVSPELRLMRMKTLAITVGSMLYFVLICSYLNWHGQYCYGPRYLVVVLPVVMVGLLGYDLPNSRLVTRVSFVFLVLLIVVIQAGPGLFPNSFWGMNPVLQFLSSLGLRWS